MAHTPPSPPWYDVEGLTRRSGLGRIGVAGAPGPDRLEEISWPDCRTRSRSSRAARAGSDSRRHACSSPRVRAFTLSGSRAQPGLGDRGARRGACPGSLADVTDEEARWCGAVAGGCGAFRETRRRRQQRRVSAGRSCDFVDGSSELVRAYALRCMCWAAFHVLKHTIPRISDGGQHHHHLQRRRPDRIPGLPAYVAAKHGQVGLMRAAAKELAPRRIRVNTMHPGPTSTAFQDDIEMRATEAARGGREGLRRDRAARSAHDTRRDRPRHALSRSRTRARW